MLIAIHSFLGFKTSRIFIGGGEGKSSESELRQTYCKVGDKLSRDLLLCNSDYLLKGIEVQKKKLYVEQRSEPKQAVMHFFLILSAFYHEFLRISEFEVSRTFGVINSWGKDHYWMKRVVMFVGRCEWSGARTFSEIFK